MPLRTRSASKMCFPKNSRSFTMIYYHVRENLRFRSLPAGCYTYLIMLISGSMLHAMFSGRFDTKPSEDGSYFIDRDGTHFRYILNYLRTGQVVVPEDKVLRKELLAEAHFYQIEGIINEINELKARALRGSLRLSSEPGVSNRWMRNIRNNRPWGIGSVLEHQISKNNYQPTGCFLFSELSYWGEVLRRTSEELTSSLRIYFLSDLLGFSHTVKIHNWEPTVLGVRLNRFLYEW